MKNWKVVKCVTSKVYYIADMNLNKVSYSLIKDNLTRKEALNFWKIITKLRR